MSDKDDKPRLGFRTTATELQDRFEELSAKVEKKEKYWAELQEFFRTQAKEVTEDAHKEKNAQANGQ